MRITRFTSLFAILAAASSIQSAYAQTQTIATPLNANAINLLNPFSTLLGTTAITQNFSTSISINNNATAAQRAQSLMCRRNELLQPPGFADERRELHTGRHQHAHRTRVDLVLFALPISAETRILEIRRISRTALSGTRKRRGRVHQCFQLSRLGVF